MHIRPMNDWVLVRVDPAPATIGTIIVPDTATVHGIRTATVVDVGSGKLTVSGRLEMSVRVGERVCFHRWNLEHKNGQAIMHVLSDLGPDYGLIREGDVLVAWPPNEMHEVTSL